MLTTRDDNAQTRTANTPVNIEELEPQARFSLRVREGERAAVSSALGLDLPERIGDRVASDERVAACLGPDEWLILAPEVQRTAIVAALAEVYSRAPHSLTDISDRERAFRISGPEAITLLSIGCPRDLETLEPGRVVRTVFDGAQVVLWRDAPDVFRMDVWQSFTPHVYTLLEIGQAELSALEHF